MKIYTEINYEFKDGELIEIDSEYFDYVGDLLLCGGSGKSDDDDGSASSESTTEEEAEELGLNDTSDDTTDDDTDDEIVESTGFAERVKGYAPYLKITKETEGKGGGKFTRGSLRVKKPKISPALMQ